MILLALILIPLVAGALAWPLEGMVGKFGPRWISLVALVVEAILVLGLWFQGGEQAGITRPGAFFEELHLRWIPQFGISIYLGMDGLSLILVGLTVFLGIVSVVISIPEIEEKVGLFHMNLLWTLAGVIGVFLALDLFLFYFFWELMIVPMYFLISVWGHENRSYAAIKFFIFTQASGLLMLVSILGVFFLHGRETGVYTFNYVELLGSTFGPTAETWLMLGFFVAFAVKLPMVPFHTWLPDAHTEAPTAGSVILAGLLLKTGGYGFLRFVLPLFPEASARFASVAMILAVIGILYGAVLAFGQTDLKRLVAYTSVSHLGFVLLGAFADNSLGLQGAVMEMVSHGISTGALFILVGVLQQQLHTRDIRQMGGFWAIAPRMGGLTLFFALASLGLPGLGNFVGEFLAILGAFQQEKTIAAVATLGFVYGTVYSLWIVQKVFQGPRSESIRLQDLSGSELWVMGIMVVSLLWLGVYPQPVLDIARPALKGITHEY